MAYNSILFLCAFLPVSLLCYQLLPKRFRWAGLLVFSYGFILLFSGKLIVYLFITTLSVYGLALGIEKCKMQYKLDRKTATDKKALKAAFVRKKRALLWFGIVLNIGILAFLKYYDFFGHNFNLMFHLFHLPDVFPKLNLLTPIGISFYTLQAVSYLSDVYNGKVTADENLGRVALFLSFFPIVMEGPICRYDQIAADVYAGRPLRYKNLESGFIRVLWGLFKKIVIADRLNVIVGEIFDHNEKYGGLIIILGAVAYTYQLYMEFSGCIDMTIGVGEMFGVKLPENFRQPFFSRSASEFWRRWHITLGAFFRDYVFYPISLTKFVKKVGKKARGRFKNHFGQVIPSAFALFGVWICNGLWHGTGWTFIAYGMYYFVIILLENILEPYSIQLTNKLKINRESGWFRALQIAKTLVIIFFGELIFRAPRMLEALSMIRSIFTDFSFRVLTDGTLLDLKFSIYDYAVCLVGLVIVLVVGILHEKGLSIRNELSKRPLALRFSAYMLLLVGLVVFGAYSGSYAPVDPIYAGF